MKEYVILQLRLIKGVNKNSFKRKFDVDIDNIFAVEIKELIKNELLIDDSKNIYLSKRGKEVANIVLEKFI